MCAPEGWRVVHVPGVCDRVAERIEPLDRESVEPDVAVGGAERAGHALRAAAQR